MWLRGVTVGHGLWKCFFDCDKSKYKYIHQYTLYKHVVLSYYTMPIVMSKVFIVLLTKNYCEVSNGSYVLHELTPINATGMPFR